MTIIITIIARNKSGKKKWAEIKRNTDKSLHGAIAPHSHLLNQQTEAEWVRGESDSKNRKESSLVFFSRCRFYKKKAVWIWRLLCAFFIVHPITFAIFTCIFRMWLYTVCVSVSVCVLYLFWSRPTETHKKNKQRRQQPASEREKNNMNYDVIMISYIKKQHEWIHTIYTSVTET